MECILARFDALPLAAASVDIALFNASIHYSTDLSRVLGEARRVTRRGGQMVILDSPFYEREIDGLAMVAEKRERFGPAADALMALPFIEFLTVERLRRAASAGRRASICGWPKSHDPSDQPTRDSTSEPALSTLANGCRRGSCARHELGDRRWKPARDGRRRFGLRTG
jgi:SAM-dependent methyltransferase